MTTDHYEYLRTLLDIQAVHLSHGCTDHYCRLVKRPPGMHTNGGCKCIGSLADMSKMIAEAADKVRCLTGSAPVFDKSTATETYPAETMAKVREALEASRSEHERHGYYHLAEKCADALRLLSPASQGAPS